MVNIRFLSKKLNIDLKLVFIVGSILLIPLVLIYFLRFELIHKHETIAIYRDLIKSEWFYNSSSEGVTGKTYYVITNNKKPVLLIYHDRLDFNTTLLIREVKEDSVDIFIYNSCAYFRVPLKKANVELRDVKFLSIDCSEKELVFIKENYFKDYTICNYCFKNFNR